MKRHLDIGPHSYPAKGFETLDARPGFDIQADASEPLPIADGTYDIVHSSHVIEHIAWWKTEQTLREWARILKPGGRLEVWTMNAAYVAELLLRAEAGEDVRIPDRWYRRNKEKDIFKWCAGRVFSYDLYEPWSWHRALMTPRYLKKCMEKVGLIYPFSLPDSMRRGHNHGAMNMGVAAIKPCAEGHSPSCSYLCKERGSSGARSESTPDQSSTPQSKCSQSPEPQGISFFELPSQE